MQTSICYTERDRWLLNQVSRKANLERRSMSSVILSILEEHFVNGRKIGEILQDMGHLSSGELTKALEIQEQEEGRRRLGKILLAQDFVKEKDLESALVIQKHISHN